MVYSSKQNPLIKEINALKDKKYRNKFGLYIAEGVKMVNEAVSLGVEVVTVVATTSVINQIKSGSYKLMEVTDDVFSYLSDEATPQGALAVIKIKNVEVNSPKGNCLLLDGVADPGNMGTIIRTAAAFGYTDLYLINCVDPYSNKAVRASMSGIYFVNVYKTDYQTAFSALSGVDIIVADMGGKNLDNYANYNKHCIVVGNEANGVSETVKTNATDIVGIPMSATSESLNVAVASAIMMYKLKK